MIAAAAVAGALGAGCGVKSAPVCQRDADCADGRHCVPQAGVCVAFDSPLLPAPDGGAPADAAADAADAAAAADAADAPDAAAAADAADATG